MALSTDRISLTTLRLFVAIAEEAALNRAAEREAIAPSAASKRLADLEADLHVILFERNPRGMRPTIAGESLLRHARRILSAAGALTAEMAEFRVGIRGHVRVLANLSAIVAYLPEELEQFFLNHPELRIELEERPTDKVIQGVVEGWAELGICSGDADLRELKSLAYRCDRLVMAMRKDHPLASGAGISFVDTLPYDQIGLHADSSIFIRSRIAAREAGLPLRRRIHVPGFDAVCRTVQANLGIALIPEPVFNILGPPMGLHSEQLKDAWASREIVLVHHPDCALSRAAEALKNFLIPR
ncbi:LysR family transcriptional regulator [Agrobacterium rosae]|uniref:LysR substrate-binding domain-containing protein n=1 Tax=Agrobacterium rosae TaxID=1972867 RepID=UPI0019D34636|nr:LysR substrate-binding domain-containing protein [Agrobacterium rosae]MBN7806983.1 LysR family transcriptional regulator [Agrobacterium rosae]